MKIRFGNLLLPCALIFFGLVVVLGLRGSYKTPDEIFYLENSRTDLEIGYFIWSAWVQWSERLFSRSAYFVNSFLIIVALLFLYRKRVISSNFIALICFFPSVVFFANSYLRDISFLIIALSFMRLHDAAYGSILRLALLLFVFLLRFEFGLILLGALIFASEYVARFRKLIVIGFLLVYLSFSIGLVFSVDLRGLYFDFFYFGHGIPDVNERVGLLLVTWKDFADIGGAVNAILAPFLFWLRVVESGSIFFQFLYLFEFFICCGLVCQLAYKVISPEYFFNNSLRLARISLYMVLFSLLFSIFVQGPSELLRFRLFFYPFFVYLALEGYRKGTSPVERLF